MKVLFSKSIFMLSLLPLLAGAAHAQTQNNGTWDNHKLHYGIQAGFTINTVDLYSTSGGVAHALEEGNHTIYAPGFHFAVIGEVQLGRYFNLRAMPGVSLFKNDWEPTGMMLPAYLLVDNYKMESACGEVPIDVKFKVIRWGNVEPYLVSGLCYRFDFASLRNDNDNESIQPLNAHDLRFSFGCGLDWYTRYLKLGFEFKASLGILPPHTEVGNHTGPFFFHNGKSISISLIIEA